MPDWNDYSSNNAPMNTLWDIVFICARWALMCFLNRLLNISKAFIILECHRSVPPAESQFNLSGPRGRPSPTLALIYAPFDASQMMARGRSNVGRISATGKDNDNRCD